MYACIYVYIIMERYFKSIVIYFHELKASENALSVRLIYYLLYTRHFSKTVKELCFKDASFRRNLAIHLKLSRTTLGHVGAFNIQHSI